MSNKNSWWTEKKAETTFRETVQDVIFQGFHPYWAALFEKGPGKIPDSMIFIFMLIKHDNYSNQSLFTFDMISWLSILNVKNNQEEPDPSIMLLSI